MIVIVGKDGNMGKRYAAVLSHLGIEFSGYDVTTKPSEIRRLLDVGNKFIVATPTECHGNSIHEINDVARGVDILCEKPITKHDIELTYDQCESKKNNLYCVNQYEYLRKYEPQMSGSVSSYDYFNHGKDGIHWDCFQIYALAKHKVTVAETSPVWKCWSNGEKLNIADMDAAYIAMMKDFLGEKKRMWTKERIIATTKRIQDIAGVK